MRKSSKLLLAGATVWPFFYMVLFFAFVLFMVFVNANGSEPPPVLLFLIFPLHFLTMLLIFGLTVFYIVNVFRNDRVVKDMKVLWAVVIFLGNIIAMPIYWYLYIWRETPSASAPPQLNPITSSTAQPTSPNAAYVPPSKAPDWR
jgi:hypothetical protein